MTHVTKDPFKHYKDMRYYLLISLAALFFCACNKEEGIGPATGERNWLVLEDSDDPIDHQRHEIFTEFGIPVYYNDTIGSETRYSMSGEYTYYERLQVFYNPGSSAVNGRFTLVKDKNDVKPVLDYLQTELLPLIPESFYIPSILLVDSLVVNRDSTAYKGFNTVICGKVRQFSTMDENARTWWRGGVMRALVVGGLMENESAWLEDNFFGLTLAVNPENPDRMYSTSSPGYMVSLALGTAVPQEEQCLGVCGFLDYKSTATNPRYAYVPTRQGDVEQFCEAIFAMDEAEFTERWGMYPVVMEKYEAMKGKLAEYGFTIE